MDIKYEYSILLLLTFNAVHLLINVKVCPMYSLSAATLRSSPTLPRMPCVPLALSGSVQADALFLGRPGYRGSCRAAVEPLAAAAALQVAPPLGAAGQQAGVAL